MKYENHTAEFHNGTISIYNMDCMELLRQTPDKYYELAIIDPPYGLQNGKNRYSGGGLHTKSCVKFGSRFQMADDYNGKKWDNKLCDDAFFQELYRTTRNQIIWGANYYSILSPCRGFIVWDKGQVVDNFSACEYAYSSFDTPSRIFRFRNYGIFQTDKTVVHPTQKPAVLYEWLLTKYAKKGDKILDTHGGSMSIAIACHNQGYALTACELDKDYYEAAVLRIRQHQSQKRLVFAEEGENNDNRQQRTL